MPFCTQTTYQRGGRELVDLLTHCVFSFNTDALFLFLVREYQFRPQADSALAIYDVFCAANAPARISDTRSIPPKDMRIDHAICTLRREFLAATQPPDATQPDGAEVAGQDSAGQGSADESPENQSETVAVEDVAESTPPAIPLPPRYLFDSIATQLAVAESSKVKALEKYYDPKLTPKENLPGGELSAGQRSFVDNVWSPRIRPYLVSAGFWKLATVG